MLSSIFLLLGAAAVYWTLSTLYQLRVNIRRAKATGLHVVVAPFLPYTRAWQATHEFWLPYFKYFPKSWWEDWLTVCRPDWVWLFLRAPFDRFGDSFIVAAPAGLHMYTSDATLIAQLTARRDHFPKSLKDYSVLALLGLNVVVTEGSVWRFHRKVTSASFNERNAAHTFAESVSQARSMAARWLGDDGKGDRTIGDIEHDTMTLALNIIGYVGFGLRLLWPGEPVPDGADPKVARYGSSKPPPGHSLSFSDALAGLLAKILVILVIPWSILKILPFKWAKDSWQSFQEYNQYMQELLQDKIEEVRKGEEEGHKTVKEDGMDIMGQLVRTKYGSEAEEAAPSEKKKKKTGAEKKGSSNGPATMAMTDDEIISNAFIMLLAGHETTANTLHFALLYLACAPESQRRLQRDVDALVGRDSDPASWVFEEVINGMMGGMLGAVMNEVLRMVPPVVEVPKMVTAAQDQVVMVKGGTERVSLPAGMTIALSAVGAHRNPKYWPERPSKLTSGKGDLDDFVPERWFRSSSELETTAASDAAGDAAAAAEEDGDHISGKGVEMTSAALFRPPRGAFIPFSEGPRSCLGRRIAQVESVAVLAVLFQRYSVELAVEEWASDAEADAMSKEDKEKVYDRARDKCRATIRTAKSIITLKLHGSQHVPIRLVPRGKERFVSWVDA